MAREAAENRPPLWPFREPAAVQADVAEAGGLQQCPQLRPAVEAEANPVPLRPPPVAERPGVVRPAGRWTPAVAMRDYHAAHFLVALAGGAGAPGGRKEKTAENSLPGPIEVDNMP